MLWDSLPTYRYQNRDQKVVSFFKKVDGVAELWLIDEHGIKAGTYHMTDRPFSRLVEELSSHACLVYDCAMKHFDAVPYWDEKSPVFKPPVLT